MRVARSDALRLVYEACKERCPMSFDRFAAAFDGWKVAPIERDGKMVATILMRGNEIHCAAKEPGKWLSRKVLRDSIGAILEQHGICTTAVMADNSAGHAFVQRLGFKRTTSGEIVRYELKEMTHVR